MSEKKIIKPVALAVGVALAGTFAISGAVNADTVENPFSMSTLSAGYMLGAAEGSCGEDKKAKVLAAKTRRPKAAVAKVLAALIRKHRRREGSCGEDKKAEGSCGEGSCGADTEHKDAEGACGEEKKAEGSCGSDHT